MDIYVYLPNPGGSSSGVSSITSGSSAIVITGTSNVVITLDESQISVTEAQSIVKEYVAGETISALQAVYYDVLTDKIMKADKEDLIEASVIGIAINAGIENELIRVIQYGVLQDMSFSFSVADLIFLTNNGILSATAPTTGYLTRLGRAVDTDSILVLLETPISI